MSSDRAAALQPVHRAEVDGVPVFWVDTPGRLHAELVFGVGLADETFLTTGVTHLVEHLTMRALGESAHAANAGVGVSTTSFEVSSSPGVVAEHLRRVSLALASPEVGQLDVERRVVVAEEHSQGRSPTDWWPLTVRYGARGPGLVGNRELAPHLLRPAEVLDWGRRWFHRGNAALVLNGPPPDGLTLPLPDGPPVQRAPRTARELPTPACATAPTGGLLAALHGTWSAELAAGLSVLSTRLTRRLRHDAGVVYRVDLDATHLPGGIAVAALEVDAAEEHVATVAASLLDTLDELCGPGPTGPELDHVREVLREFLDDPGSAIEGAMGAAVELLTGIHPSTRHQERMLAGVEPAAVAAALRQVRDSMVVGLPEGQQLLRLPELPACSVPPVTGRVLRRARFRSEVPRGSELVVGAEGLTLTVGRGADPVTVRFADVVGVGVEPDPSGRLGDELHAVVSVHDDWLPLYPRDWRDGRAAVEALRAAVPAELFYDTPRGMRMTDG